MLSGMERGIFYWMAIYGRVCGSQYMIGNVRQSSGETNRKAIRIEFALPSFCPLSDVSRLDVYQVGLGETQFDIFSQDRDLGLQKQLLSVDAGMSPYESGGCAKNRRTIWSEKGRSMFHSASYIISALMGLVSHHSLLEPVPLKISVSAVEQNE
jgi:hypothetical protein